MRRRIIPAVKKNECALHATSLLYVYVLTVQQTVDQSISLHALLVTLVKA